MIAVGTDILHSKDFIAEHQAEVKISVPDRKGWCKIWVNVDGVCAVRVRVLSRHIQIDDARIEKPT